MLIGMVPAGHSLYQYYCGWDRTHGQGRTAENPRPKHPVQMGDPIAFRLKQRMDGFISADSAYTGGELLTKPVELRGPWIVLNIDTSASGCAHAALLDENEKPIEGFGLDDCALIHGNDTFLKVQWKSGADMSPLVGRKVRLHVRSRATKLFAVYPGQEPLEERI